jgi:DNA (cytosine-5)-methyltransferase 1
MVANRHGDEIDWPANSPICPTLFGAIGDLPAIPAGHMVEETPRPGLGWRSAYVTEMRRGLRGKEARIVRDHVTRVHRPEDIRAFRHMGEGDTYGSVPKKLRRYRDDIFSDKYHRMEWDEPAWTVTAHLAKDGYKYIHPEQHRTLSVREAARIQSFPDSFRFAGNRTHRYIQVGNAVPPKLATAIGESLLPIVR